MKNFLRISLLLILAGLLNKEGTDFFLSALNHVIGTAYAQDWKVEFDDICKKTNAPMSMTKDELKQIITRCNKLSVVMGTMTQNESERKVYLRRLRVCHDLFVFTLESKDNIISPLRIEPGQ